MHVGKPNVTSQNSKWNSSFEVVNEINVQPGEKNYSEGTYRCMVETLKGGDEQLGIAVYIREAKPVVELKQGESVDVSISDSAFFKYTIQAEVCLDQLLHLLKISQKQNLQVYMNKKGYPSSLPNQNTYALGDIPDQVI